MLPKFPNCEGRWTGITLPGNKARDKRGNGLNLCHGKFRLNTRENFFMGRVMRHWKRLAREAVECPSRRCLRNDWMWHSAGWVTRRGLPQVGLGGPGGFFQGNWFSWHPSVILVRSFRDNTTIPGAHHPSAGALCRDPSENSQLESAAGPGLPRPAALPPGATRRRRRAPHPWLPWRPQVA